MIGGWPRQRKEREAGAGVGVGGGASPSGRLHSLWSSLLSRFVGVLGQINTSHQPSEMATRPIVPQNHQPRGEALAGDGKQRKAGRL